MIKKIEFNWFSTSERPYWEEYEVGKNGVLEILEHRPLGEGDKWYYYVSFEDRHWERIFNINRVYFDMQSSDTN